MQEFVYIVYNKDYDPLTEKANPLAFCILKDAEDYRKINKIITQTKILKVKRGENLKDAK